MATPIIELRGAVAVRQDVEILRAASFALAEGRAAFFMGTAGSGKSMLLKIAAGLVVPSSGEVFFRGKPLSRMSRLENQEFRRVTGYVFQDAALWANQSLYDNLALPIRVHDSGASRAEVDRMVHRAAEIVGYSQELRARPAELSSGERRLIGLARALVLDPELLFMDEPAANLDESAAERVTEIVGALKARGRSLLVVTSISKFAWKFADEVGVLNDGALIAYGPYADIAARTEGSLRGITGRLRPRQAAEAEAPAPGSGLLGAWAAALAEDPRAGQDFERPRPRDEDGATLGDIINAIPDEESDADREDGK
ncbi:MAG TPA: ATP-binding cassette domain-containing protein [Rectinemataceae bacterium]|nr:ATP-binding cassette domain-containing protein [Rectinemataceae bacterium]